MTRSAAEVYALALAQEAPTLHARRPDGTAMRLALERWMGPLTAADEAVLDRAQAPVLDVGCGPGRHVLALARRGHLALGVDIAPATVRVARMRGAAAIEASVFARIPGAGTWGSALLLDGNIGIGGAPDVLLARLRELLRAGGEMLVELAAWRRDDQRAAPPGARRPAQPAVLPGPTSASTRSTRRRARRASPSPSAGRTSGAGSHASSPRGSRARPSSASRSRDDRSGEPNESRVSRFVMACPAHRH